MPEGVTYLLRTKEDEYVRAVTEQGGQFDVVVIDGWNRLRPECGNASLDYLTERGVVVWDNSNRMSERYREVYDKLAKRGFRRLDFFSHGPIWVREWPTSVFYRNDNCLGI